MTMTLDGALLRMTRLTIGYSQAHLAQMVGISSVVLSRLEDDHHEAGRRLTLEQVDRLAEVLGLDPPDMLHAGNTETMTDQTEAREVGDAARLVATLAASARAVKPRDLVDQFGFRHADLARAVRAANEHLASIGLIVNDDPKGLTLRPRTPAAYDDAAAILAARSTLEGLDSYYMKVLWRIHTHRVQPGNGVQSSRTRQTYAMLERLGLVEPLANGFAQTEPFASAFPDLDGQSHNSPPPQA